MLRVISGIRPSAAQSRNRGCFVGVWAGTTAAITRTVHYTTAMPRFAPALPDLFAPADPPPAPPPPDPIDELTAPLDMLRAAQHRPWPDATATMAEEHRALSLARMAGAEGEALAAAILEETERLLSATD